MGLVMDNFALQPLEGQRVDVTLASLAYGPSTYVPRAEQSRVHTGGLTMHVPSWSFSRCSSMPGIDMAIINIAVLMDILSMKMMIQAPTKSDWDVRAVKNFVFLVGHLDEM